MTVQHKWSTITIGYLISADPFTNLQAYLYPEHNQRGSDYLLECKLLDGIKYIPPHTALKTVRCKNAIGYVSKFGFKGKTKQIKIKEIEIYSASKYIN